MPFCWQTEKKFCLFAQSTKETNNNKYCQTDGHKVLGRSLEFAEPRHVSHLNWLIVKMYCM